jgi:hypothetical protein
MTFKKKDEGEGAVTVAEIQLATMWFNILFVAPFVPHAVSFKAAGSLLFPAPKKNAAERAATMKHEPWSEYRDAAYQYTDQEDAPTRLYIPGSMFHAAISNVAIDMAGAKKAQVGRLTSVPELKLPLFGVPKIWCTQVRSSDMARTPDIRTLPILPQCATRVPIQFVPSLIKPESIGNLLAAAGHICGVGDGRPEKGKLSMGRYRICSDNDPEFLEIVRKQTRKAQDQALADPQFYDLETERLLTWFEAEKKRRAAQPTKLPKGSKQEVHPPQYGTELEDRIPGAASRARRSQRANNGRSARA